MKQFFQIIFFVLFYSKFYNIICQNEINEDIFEGENTKDYISYIIEPGKLQTEYLKYEKYNVFKVDNNIYNDNDLLVNFYSINCDIEVIGLENNIEKYDLKNDSFSFKIMNNNIENTTIKIRPRIDIINGYNKYNYTLRSCPIVINSMYDNSFLKMEKDKPTVFYFGKNIKQYNLSYELKNSFATFSFLLFYQISEFELNIINSENNKKLFYQINDSYNLFLDKKTLESELLCLERCNLNISIEYKNLNPILLNFKIIEKNSISILQKNYLNKGFISADDINSYQYYYMEVYKGEEGEIMLHNKKKKGELFGLIIPKSKINDINNSNNYPKEYLLNEPNYLIFNNHSLKLSFYFNQTYQCEEGCYLLITYYSMISQTYNSVGFEFTLFVKIWDDLDISPQIINIPFNEYIFGYFEEDSINHHYYSIFIPDNISQIIIQIEGNYIEGFMGEDKRKLNTYKKMKNIKELDINNDKNMLIYQKDNLTDFNISLNNNYISLAIRPKDYFMNILSIYYFRVLYKRKNENSRLIIPLDSNIGNICQPQKKYGDLFYCYFLLKNNYNEFNYKYSLSTSNQNKDINIHYTKVYKNNSKIDSSISEKFFINNDTNIDYISFIFEFNDDTIQKILFTFDDDDNNFYPNIYSSQIIQLNYKINKTLFFSSKYDYSLILTRINGSGIINLDNGMKLSLGVNFKEYPIFIPLTNTNIIKLTTSNKNGLLFYVKLNYLMQNNGVGEIIYGELMNEIIINKQFPIFYYMKYNNKEKMNINFRIINYEGKDIIKPSNFSIEGYILKYEYIEKKMRGEFIQLENPIKGRYDIYTETGLLQINNPNINDERHILLKIEGGNIIKNESIIMVQILSLYSKKQNEYILPINQYITGTFHKNNGQIENINTYLIRLQKEDNINEILIEFCSNFEEIKLEINQKGKFNIAFSSGTGIKKYRIKNINENEKNISLNIINNNNLLNANYIIRYFSTDEKDEIRYILDNSSCKVYAQNINSGSPVFITFEFDNLKILDYNNKIKNRTDILFKINSFLYKKENIVKNEILNTAAAINSKSSYENQTIVNCTDKKIYITFRNISSIDYIFEMQIKVHVIIKSFFLNEDFSIYSLPINLSEYLNQNDNKKLIYILIGLAGLILLIIIIFVIIYCKIYKKNRELKDKVLSISFSSGITDDAINESVISKKDEDYENTFI